MSTTPTYPSKPVRPSSTIERDVAGAVLCAGLGTRLRPATNVTPKPAVPFMGVPLAMHSMQALERAGVTHFGANTHYLPERMGAALEPLSTRGHELHVTLEEGEILGTGGGTREIWKQIGTDKTLVLCHGDVVLGADLGPILAAHRASGQLATLVLKVRDGSTTLRGVFTDQTGHVAQIIKGRSPDLAEPLIEHAFTGIQILEPELFDLIPDAGPYCLVTELYQRLLASGVRLGAHLTTAFYADLGTYERYLDAQRRVFDTPSLLAGLDWPSEHAPGVWVQEGVVIEEGAHIIGPVLLRDQVVIEAGATVGPYVVASGQVTVEPSARVSNAALWGDGHVAGEVTGQLVASTAETGDA